MSALLKAAIGGILIGWSGIAFGQESPETLQQKFDQMMTKSNNYEIYKVIPNTQINELWIETIDSIRLNKSEVSQLQGQVLTLDTQIDSLQNQLGKIQVELAETKQKTESIQFLGANMTKTAYHWMVWSIVVVLCVGLIFLYLYAMTAAKANSRAKKDHEYLRKEFEAHKDKSRETQVRLKRELQTAVNTIDELKKGKISR